MKHYEENMVLYKVYNPCSLFITVVGMEKLHQEIERGD